MMELVELVPHPWGVGALAAAGRGLVAGRKLELGSGARHCWQCVFGLPLDSSSVPET